MRRKNFLKHLEKILEVLGKKEFKHFQNPGVFHERRLERDLVKTEIRGEITERTWWEYDILYEILVYRERDEMKRFEFVTQKRFVREYTEKTHFRRVVPQVYEEQIPEIFTQIKDPLQSSMQGSAMGIYC